MRISSGIVRGVVVAAAVLTLGTAGASGEGYGIGADASLVGASAAARQANDELGKVRVHYVDTYTPFREGGHEVCGRGPDFLHGITHVGRDPLSGWYRSFHLNNAGHAEVARLLADEVSSTFRPSIGLAQPQRPSG